MNGVNAAGKSRRHLLWREHIPRIWKCSTVKGRHNMACRACPPCVPHICQLRGTARHPWGPTASKPFLCSSALGRPLPSSEAALKGRVQLQEHTACFCARDCMQPQFSLRRNARPLTLTPLPSRSLLVTEHRKTITCPTSFTKDKNLHFAPLTQVELPS
jgi:hypothetical protein